MNVNPKQEVEDFLAARGKRLPAIGDWRIGNRPDEFRLKLPIEWRGELTAFQLELIVAPDAPSPDLRIVLLYGRAIWRLCLAPAVHPNSLRRPDDLPAMVSGPHHHSWPDNRHFGAANRLPKDLQNARKLPASVVANDDAFTFFLDQVGIDLPSWGPLKWPTRERLL